MRNTNLSEISPDSQDRAINKFTKVWKFSPLKKGAINADCGIQSGDELDSLVMVLVLLVSETLKGSNADCFGCSSLVKRKLILDQSKIMSFNNPARLAVAC